MEEKAGGRLEDLDRTTSGAGELSVGVAPGDKSRRRPWIAPVGLGASLLKKEVKEL